VNNKHKDTVKSVTDLDKPEFTIVTEQGTTGDVAAQKTFKQATIRPMKGGNEATLDVCNGSSDAFVYDQSFIAVQAMQYPDCVFPLLEPFTKEPLRRGSARRAARPAAVGEHFPGFLPDLGRRIRILITSGSSMQPGCKKWTCPRRKTRLGKPDIRKPILGLSKKTGQPS